MATNFFPAELVDTVIDSSQGDRAALATYALASKGWTPRSRRHLFEQVTIYADNAREFISLLSSPNCTFSAAIRELDIRLGASGSQRWFHEFMRRFFNLAKANNMHRLAISGSRNTVIRAREDAPGARAALAEFGRESHTPITVLTVGSVTIESLVDFARILSGFPALQSLSCGAHFQDTSQPDIVSGSDQIPAITRLDLVSPSTSPLLDFLLRQGTLSTVTHLSLSQLAPADYDALTRFLGVPNNTLQNLTLKIDLAFSGVSFDTLRHSVDMTHLNALQHLVLDTIPDIPPQSAYNLLSTTSSATIKRLEISMSLTEETHRVDDLLNGAKFYALQEVTILRASWPAVQQSLPRCAARNILQEL